MLKISFFGKLCNKNEREKCINYLSLNAVAFASIEWFSEKIYVGMITRLGTRDGYGATELYPRYG